MLSEFTFFPSQALRRAMAKPMAWALLALFIAAAALPVADAASGSKGFLDTILKSGGYRYASILIYVCCGICVLFSIYLWVRLSFIKVDRPGPGADVAE